MNIEPIIAGNKPLIYAFGANKNARYKIIPFITKLNNHKEIIVIGNEISCSIGLTVKYKAPKNIDMINKLLIEAICILSINRDVKYIDKAGVNIDNTIFFNMNFHSFRNHIYTII